MNEHRTVRVELQVPPGVADPLRYVANVVEFSIPNQFRTPDLLVKGVALYDPASGNEVGSLQLITSRCTSKSRRV